ncbi:MAG: hypothetical protein ACK45H_04315, partial [Bacteroidota bacterium]
MTRQETQNYLQQITAEHIESAMRQLDEEEIPRSRQSVEYDVIDPETEIGYPPPLLIERAYTIATGEHVPTGFFADIGAKSPHFKYLGDLGFEVRKKQLVTKSLEEYLQEFAKVADDWFTKQSWLSVNYSYFQSFFREENLKKASWEDFQDMGNKLHAFNSLAIAKRNALGKPNLSIEEYRKIFLYIA